MDQFKPFKSEYEGYMGNYGNTLDRWYHRAVIILWDKQSDLINLFICDKTAALQIINGMLKKDLNQGRQALHQVLPYWPKKISDFLDSADVLNLASLAQDQTLASTLTKTLGFRSLKADNLSLFMPLITTYSEDWLLAILNFWKENREWGDYDSLLKELSPLIKGFAQKYKKISHWILNDQLSLLFSGDRSKAHHLDRRIIQEKLPKKFILLIQV